MLKSMLEDNFFVFFRWFASIETSNLIFCRCVWYFCVYISFVAALLGGSCAQIYITHKRREPCELHVCWPAADTSKSPHFVYLFLINRTDIEIGSLLMVQWYTQRIGLEMFRCASHMHFVSSQLADFLIILISFRYREWPYGEKKMGQQKKNIACLTVVIHK